jgi:hypothetical protein
MLEILSPRTRQICHEADHSPSSTATITTVCSHTSIHPTCPHAMHSDNVYHLASNFPKSKIITQQENTKYSSAYKLLCKANINTLLSHNMSVTEHICETCKDTAQNKKQSNTLAGLTRKTQKRDLSGINMEVLSVTFCMICYQKLYI